MSPTEPSDNRLLAAMPPEVQTRLFPHLQLTNLALGQVIAESGSPLTDIYFPVDAIISLLYVMETGASAEISMIGNEGLFGVSVFMGGESTTSRAVVQCSGTAYRLPGYRLKDEFGRHGAALDILLRYTQSLIAQMSQTAVCNRHHTLNNNSVVGCCCRSTGCPARGWT